MLIWAMFISVKEVSGSLSAPGLAFEASGVGSKLCQLLRTLGTQFLFNFRFTYISRLILPTSCIHPSIHLSISAIYLHSRPLTVPPVFPSIHPITCRLSSMQLLIHPFRHPPIVLPSFIQLSFCLSVDPFIHPTDESAGIF